ncbi:MAG TPA: flagellar basal body P-ring formation chaperone FlgA [Bryobacteraceae bacterium]|nr:flagellar basal body P-ring formation chaperone FlgA [Bryobacteraceae bacterium]
MMMAFPFLMALSALPPGCHTISSDVIFARDAAAVIPGFSRVAGDFRLGAVADSGAPRILNGVELQRIARNQGVELEDVPDVCFALRVFVPQVDEIRAALRQTLRDVPEIDAARIEISSSSQRPVPFGELVFPRSGLQLPYGIQQEAMWRGFVRHSGGDFPVWAKVRVIANVTRVVAIANIPSGKPVQRNQVRVENCEDSLLDETTARNLDEVIGYLPKSVLRADLPIRKTQLAPPPDVAKGELVDVQVFAGAAHLVVKAKAQADGIKGSTILMHNLSSGKDFPAMVVGKNRVMVGDSVQ